MKNHPDIRDEEILLLGLCRLSFKAELTMRLKALTEGKIDWNYFTSLASIHGVAAMVYHNLEKLDFLQVMPQEVTGILRNTLMISLSRNTRNTEVMAAVLKLMNEHSIKSVLLKGLALESSVYGNAGLRQMTDIDVLMTREDCFKARSLLMDNGFVSLPVKSVFHKAIMADTGKHLPTLIKDQFRIELHHELFSAGKNELTKMLYDTSYETEVKGEKAFIPEPRIFFLYLVKHLYTHEMNNESQLRLYADLVVLIEEFRDEILTADLIKYAEQAGICEILARRLEPLRDFWDISFPDWINEFMDKYFNPATIDKFVFFLKSPKDNPAIDHRGFYRQIFREIPGIHRKVLFILGDLFPTITFMKNRYNCSKGWQTIFYYPLRWGKLWYLVKR